MISQDLIRAADLFFTAVLLMAALLGVALAWAIGDLVKLSLAMLVVAILAPAAHRRFRIG
ncbi:hypothetical protein [Falsiroseomonas oryzae]|uniref:hypothetical protein n=1 Tax=Falsiroseomonas oryzae TaxID=2766473 RepID=UPI0022EA265C|nr:hypothetical protein [Roseomonas sp. MO-31]